MILAITAAAAALSIATECERFDVLGAVDWLRGRGHAQVGLLGASMGAASSLLAAADEPAVRAVVADSAFADFGAQLWITASQGHIGSYRAGPEAYTERVLGFFGQHLVAQA